MEVRMDEGIRDDGNDVDLSAYGGSKPEFFIKEQDLTASHNIIFYLKITIRKDFINSSI